MAKLKVQLHLHSKEDPIDNIKLTSFQLIDLAAKLNYDAMAITCHNVLIFTDELKNYAAEKRIILIPGIEKTISKKHVVIINANLEAQKIRDFNDLRHYRENNKDCLILAAHPYFPSWTSLGKYFDKHHDLFDAVEYSWFHSQKLNWFNKKAQKSAEKYRLPVLATSDCHLWKYFDSSYSLIDAEKNTKSIINSIKNGKIDIVSHNVKAWKLPFLFLKITALEMIKKITLK